VNLAPGGAVTNTSTANTVYVTGGAGVLAVSNVGTTIYSGTQIYDTASAGASVNNLAVSGTGISINSGGNSLNMTPAGGTAIGGAASVNGLLSAKGGATVSGGTLTAGTTVLGGTTAATLLVGGAATVPGSTLAVAGGATVTGGTTTDTLLVGGATAVPGSTLAVAGGETINGGSNIYSGTGTGYQLAVSSTGAYLTTPGGASVGVTGTTAGLHSGGGASVVAAGTTSTMTSGNGYTAISAYNGGASIGVTNTTTGYTHGLTVNQTNTVLSGGTDSTTMTLDNNGATFANSAAAGGGPAQLHGVANGTSYYDAVNLGQLNSATNKLKNQMSGGIAATAAMSQIPQVEPGRKFSIGAGAAGYGNTGAFAVGASMRFSDQLVAKASIGLSPTGNGTQVAGGAGLSYSW
jgi:hypothetical protein